MKYLPLPLLSGILAALITWMSPIDALTSTGGTFMPAPLFAFVLTAFMATADLRGPWAVFGIPAVACPLYGLLAAAFGWVSWGGSLAYAIMIYVAWFIGTLAAFSLLKIVGKLSGDSRLFLPSGVVVAK